MVFMVFANMTVQSQTKFWAEAVATSCFHENLTIKADRKVPALEAWADKSASKWMNKLVEFGRVGVMNKKMKIHGKMQERGEPVMMVGYALNHGSGTYRVYNPKTNRIVLSRNVVWGEFKSKKLEDSLDVFSVDDSSSEESVDSSNDSSTVSSRDGTIISISDSSSSDSNGSDGLSTTSSEGATTIPSKSTTISKPRAKRRSTAAGRSSLHVRRSRTPPPSSISM